MMKKINKLSKDCLVCGGIGIVAIEDEPGQPYKAVPCPNCASDYKASAGEKDYTWSRELEPKKRKWKR